MVIGTIICLSKCFSYEFGTLTLSAGYQQDHETDGKSPLGGHGGRIWGERCRGQGTHTAALYCLQYLE